MRARAKYAVVDGALILESNLGTAKVALSGFEPRTLARKILKNMCAKKYAQLYGPPASPR